MDTAATLDEIGTAKLADADVRAVVASAIAPDVARIDRDGVYPRDGLRQLGQAGAFASHLAAYTRLERRSIAAAIADMATVGEACMSTAFCVWCQDTCGWYLEQTDNAPLRTRLQPGIASGELLGGTGLSNPIKALAGIEPFRLRGERVDGGWTVSGVLPWVSNLGDGHWFGTVFADAAHDAHLVMAMVRCGENGVAIRQNAHFVALEGTATYSVLFRRAFVPDEDVLADPADALIPRIRPGFALLQTGMGFGVIAGAIAGMRADDRAAGGSSNSFLRRGADDFEEAAASLWQRVSALADRPGSGPGYLRAVLQARLDVSELVLEATTAGVLHAGARGYLEGSAVARRQREGNFVAIITPSVRQLRQELATLASN